MPRNNRRRRTVKADAPAEPEAPEAAAGEESGTAGADDVTQGRRRFKLKVGCHYGFVPGRRQRQRYVPGDVVVSTRPLDEMFGREKFEPLD